MSSFSCPGCEKRVSYAAPTCPYCARPNPSARVLDALRAYVGERWEEHYRDAFVRLLQAEETGTKVGWTWNWPAAFSSLWFLYRRLYFAFLMQLGLRVILLQCVVFGAMVARDLGIPLRIVTLGGAAVFLVLFAAGGCLGDRLLFRKALAQVKAAGTPADTWRLSQRGKPLGWAVGAFAAVPALLVLAILFAIPGPGAERARAMRASEERFASRQRDLFGPPAPLFEAPRPFVESPPPPREPPRLVVSADRKSRIVVPGTWHDLRSSASDAQIEVGDSLRGVYVAVMTESRAALPSGVDLERYTRHVMESSGKGLTRRTVSAPVAFAIGGKPAIQHEVRGTGDGTPLVFWVTTVKGARSYHRVVAWTHASQAETVRPLARTVTNSFQETGK